MPCEYCLLREALNEFVYLALDAFVQANRRLYSRFPAWVNILNFYLCKGLDLFLVKESERYITLSHIHTHACTRNRTRTRTHTPHTHAHTAHARTHAHARTPTETQLNVPFQE